MLTEMFLRQIERDLSAFSDPGSLVEVSPKGVLRWTRGREELSAQLVHSAAGFPEVSFRGRQLPYDGFLASEQLADLRDLAVSIKTQIPAIDDFTTAPARELGHTEGPLDHPDALGLILERTVSALPFGSTRVLFVHGNAGAGKTSLLRYLTRLQAEKYLEGQTRTLLLYLDAQGKGLSQLEDVMARALQDLRARFTYHCLAPLTRRLCVVPIIDGFDELIGPSSAGEAFGNLAQFLSQLDCEGAVITSSRSAFIDYATLHARATDIAKAQGLSYEIYPIDLLPWPDATVFDLARRRLQDVATGEGVLRHLLQSEAAELIRKPFFLAHVCGILNEGGTVRGDSDLESQVVAAALERESSKLRDSRTKPLLTAQMHRRLCEAIADEMWWQERADLDCQTIRTIAELFADEAGLAPQETKLLVDRSIAHGLLGVAVGDPDKRAFEHEVFRFEFQAGRLATALGGTDGTLRDYLLRRELPQELVERVKAHRRYSAPQAIDIIGRLSDEAKKARNNPFAATNAGTLAINLLREHEGQLGTGRLESVHVRFSKLGKVVLSGWSIRDCVFERVDLGGCSLIHCDLSGTVFICCGFDLESSLADTEVGPPAFAGIEWLNHGETYDPALIFAALERLGAKGVRGSTPPPVASPEVKARIETIERLFQHARTHFYLSFKEPWVQNRLVADATWPRVERLLRAHGLLVDVQIRKSGPAETFWRLTRPPDLIWQARALVGTGKDPALEAFWTDVMSNK